MGKCPLCTPTKGLKRDLIQVPDQLMELCTKLFENVFIWGVFFLSFSEPLFYSIKVKRKLYVAYSVGYINV